MLRTEFNIPIPRHLKKWLVASEFNNMSGPYKIEEDSLIGKQFMAIVQDRRAKPQGGPGELKDLSDTLCVVLSEAMAKRSPTIAKLMSINYYLAKMFRHDLLAWIKSQEDAGVKPFVSSKAFLRHYKIEEAEYSHDAAYKTYQRSKIEGYRRPKKRVSASG